MDEQTVLSGLISMSLELGRPENDYVILGEGNTSARIDEDHFFVKASGKYLSKADKDTFVKVKLREAAAIMDSGELTDEEIKDALLAACADPANKLRPSVETTFHSFLLSIPGVNFVGHVHATAVNAVLCSMNAEEIVKHRIFPEHIVYCGIEPVYIEYVDPGLALARVIRERVRAYIDKHGCNPKEILMQNHGIITLGATTHEVESVVAMACKAARVISGACHLGGPRFMPKEHKDRIYGRPDEHYRTLHLKE